MTILITLISLLALLGGCTTISEAPPGQPPRYHAGYKDGCPSGESAAGWIYAGGAKNADLFSSDELYRQGWTEGFDRCNRSVRETNEEARRFFGRAPPSWLKAKE